MLPRLTIGFLVLSAAIGIAACSSYGATSTVNVGPNFPSLTLYATNSNQNAVSIYNKGQKTGSGPAFQIGGSNTTLNGPQYLAFDSSHNLWITNFNPSTNQALLVEIEALATGNVVPLSSTAISGHPRGIAITAKVKSSASPSPPPSIMVVSDVIPTALYPSELLLFQEGSTAPYQEIAGPQPALSIPGGVALDSKDRIYVANVGGASVAQFVLPTPTPTPKPTTTPSPTPTPSGSPSPSASPSPTPTPINISPTFTISGTNTHVITPTSVAVDSAGNVYISDQGSPFAHCSSPLNAPAILVFSHPTKTGIINVFPTRKITGCATKLNAPMDVKVDSNGIIYVADSYKAGGGVVYVFAAKANGDVKPMTLLNSPGAVTGLGLVP